MPRPSFYFNAALESLHQHGLVVRQLNTSDNMAATLDLVVGGAGIGLVAEDMARPHVAGGALFPIFGAVRPPPLEFFIACHADRYYALIDRIMKMAVAGSGMPRMPSQSL